MSTNRRWTSGMFATEDWWSVWIGLALGLAAAATGMVWRFEILSRRNLR